ncbi:MAG: pitrilysin family protein [Bacteroidota bacterium]
MIKFDKFTLDNGLRVIIHQDKTTPIVALNILYNVGARDENPNKTGFAHLFEHLMFGGSINIPSYDEPLEKAGGENNAFTNNDITNYYLTIPKSNIETGFWLESDRMLSLAFSEKSLEVQRNVVSEEFKQSYLNQPYGDVWLMIRDLAYTTHPYKWPTIGKELSHIQNATMQDVKDFFNKFYKPNNAIMVVAGDITTEEVKILCNKWFAPIEAGAQNNRKLPKEPKQTQKKELRVERDVPVDAIYMAFHCCARKDKDYFATDLLSDILSLGSSSRLYQKLVKEEQLFGDLNAHISGDIDEGLFMVTGKLKEGVNFETAEIAIMKELNNIAKGGITDNELFKVKNKIESRLVFSELSVLNKAMNLAYAELIGDANGINEEINNYHAVTKEQISKVAKTIFKKENCSVIYYKSKATK